jgi:hypothetical protein
VRRALDLIRRCGGAPEEVGWEGARIDGHGLSSRSGRWGSDVAAGGLFRPLLDQRRSHA